jgi:hypothetical protein
VTVYEVKTGQERESDIVQTKLYLLCLPFGWPWLKGREMIGRVVYTNGARVRLVRPEDIDVDFRWQARRWADLLEASAALPRWPDPANCRWCEISSEDCPARVAPNGDDDIPEIEW